MVEKLSGADVRPGSEFEFRQKPHLAAPSTFASLVDGDLIIGGRFSLPPVLG
jgi:hypothetical protein